MAKNTMPADEWVRKGLQEHGTDRLQEMVGLFGQVLMSADVDAICSSPWHTVEVAGSSPAAPTSANLLTGGDFGFSPVLSLGSLEVSLTVELPPVSSASADADAIMAFRAAHIGDAP